MLRKHSQTFLLLFKLCDAAILIGSFFLAHFIWFHRSTIDVQYILVTLAIVVIWFAVTSLLKLYETQRSSSFHLEISKLIRVQAIIIFAISPPLFYMNNLFSRVYTFLYFSMSFSALLLVRIAVRLLLRYLRAKGYNTRTLAIIGGGTLARMVLDKVNQHPEFGYTDPIVLADSLSEESLAPLHRGPVASLQETLRQLRVDDVIIAYPLSKESEIIALVAQCESVGVRVRIVPDFFRLINSRAIIEDFDNLPLIGLRPEPLISLWNRFIKRCFDVIFSTGVLVGLSPLFVLLGLAVKLTSRGPVFFAQERIGHNNRIFKLYKFRSMHVQNQAASDTIWTTRNDSRVTAIGRFMRRTNLDELPQFYNVLIGNMSVVGPRPEREYFADQFATQIRAYRIRHLVRAGITGWAQVNGLRGDTSIEERIKYDHYYIENWSFWFDLKIIWLTLFGKNRNAM